MRAIFAFAALMLLASCSGSMPGRGWESVSRVDVLLVSRAWADAYDSRNGSRIASLYAPDAVLRSPEAKTIATTPGAIAEYFRNPGGSPLSSVAFGPQTIRVDGNAAVNSGTYTFNNVSPNGNSVSLPASYSMEFRHRGDQWLIVDHHSSRLP